MFKRLFNRRSVTLGLDIRPAELRYVCLEEGKGGLSVLHQGTLEVQTDDVGLLRMAQGLSQALKQRKIRPRSVIVGLPRQQCFLKVLTMPVMDQEDLGGALAFELEKHLPVDPETLVLDHRIIKGRLAREMTVQVAAAQKAWTESLLSALQAGGLQPDVLQPSSLATETILTTCRPWIFQARQALLVDEHGPTIEVDLLEGGQLVKSLVFSIEGRQGPEAVAHLEKELFRSFSFTIKGFEASKKIPWVYIGSKEGNAPRAFRALGLQPPVSIDYRAAVRASEDLDLQPYHAALGLALSSHREGPVPMNLLPAPDVAAPKPRRVSRRSALLAAILVGALGLYGAVTIRDGWEVRRLRSEAAALGPRVEEVHNLQRELNQLRSQTDAVEAAVGSRFSPLETLKELTLVVPNSAWLTESSFDGRKLLIGGYADSSQELIGPLEESPLFTNIQFQGTITKRDDKERFKISAEME